MFNFHLPNRILNSPAVHRRYNARLFHCRLHFWNVREQNLLFFTQMHFDLLPYFRENRLKPFEHVAVVLSMGLNNFDEQLAYSRQALLHENVVRVFKMIDQSSQACVRPGAL